MNFQEFLARKRALALVEHMNTLSEQDAQQLFDTLDEETVEFIQAVLNENLPVNVDKDGNMTPVYGKTGTTPTTVSRGFGTDSRGKGAMSIRRTKIKMRRDAEAKTRKDRYVEKYKDLLKGALRQ